MVVKESKYHCCSFGDIIIGTGEEYMPHIPDPIMHRYEVSDDNKRQILEIDEVVEIGKL